MFLFPTCLWSGVQLSGRALALHARGPGFETPHLHFFIFFFLLFSNFSVFPSVFSTVVRSSGTSILVHWREHTVGFGLHGLLVLSFGLININRLSWLKSILVAPVTRLPDIQRVVPNFILFLFFSGDQAVSEFPQASVSKRGQVLSAHSRLSLSLNNNNIA